MGKSETKSSRWLKRFVTKSSRDISSALSELATHSGRMRPSIPQNMASQRPSEHHSGRPETRQRPCTVRDSFTINSPRHHSSQDPFVDRPKAFTQPTSESERLYTSTHHAIPHDQIQVARKPNTYNNDHGGAIS